MNKPYLWKLLFIALMLFLSSQNIYNAEDKSDDFNKFGIGIGYPYLTLSVEVRASWTLSDKML